MASGANKVQAAITNPTIGELGNNVESAQSGNLFVQYFLVIWNALITVGAIAVLVYFLWGAIEWIVSAGDNAKVEAARNKMTQSAIGLLILVSAYTIIGFASNLLFGADFNILNPTFVAPQYQTFIPTGG